MNSISGLYVAAEARGNPSGLRLLVTIPAHAMEMVVTWGPKLCSEHARDLDLPVTDDTDRSLDPAPRDLGTFERSALIAMAVTGCVALYVGLVGVICLGVGALLDVSAVVDLGAWLGAIALLSLAIIGSVLVGALWRRWWRGDRPVIPRARMTSRWFR